VQVQQYNERAIKKLIAAAAIGLAHLLADIT